MVGIAVAIAGGPRGPEPPADPGREPTAERPRLPGMGMRVEQILRLAEKQAADVRAKAARDAERIVADARAEARAIREQAP